MTRRIIHFAATFVLSCVFIGATHSSSLPAQSGRGSEPMKVHFMTLDPGHFHAALVQKQMYPNVSVHADVYAPLGPDLIEHLSRIVGFNTRKDAPTSWQLEIHAGPDSLARMLKEKPGNVVVISGRNRGKIDKIRASVENGLNVLADKPWIIDPADFPALESALETAATKKLVAYDIMTERYEITTILQRRLLGDREVFGTILPGTPSDPAVYMESVHHLLKIVAGMPNRRPAWFFDVNQQGEAVPDVGTHLVDMVQWELFPDQPIDYRKDISVLSAGHWPTSLTKEEFQRVTGEADFPSYLGPYVHDTKLDYYCNGQVSYSLRGVHVKLDVLWRYEAPSGTGDTHHAWFKGSRSRIEIRQGKEEKYRPELYVVPNDPEDKDRVAGALRKRIDDLKKEYDGLGLTDTGKELRLDIPDRYRVGHEAHFAQVTEKFLSYLDNPGAVPAWEKPDMLAKYWVTTTALKLSREQKAGR
jgi:predicted dehydrogenase